MILPKSRRRIESSCPAWVRLRMRFGSCVKAAWSRLFWRKANGKPLLGICLGMQMLLEKSYEYGEHAGLGLIGGSVKPIAPMIGEGLKVPHIGWNRLIFPKGREKSKLFQYINEGDCVYFVHSYAGVDCDAFVSARTEYGAELTAAVERGNVYGTQFHPEKSGEVGLQILKAFCEL